MIRTGVFASRDEWDSINKAAPHWPSVELEIAQIIGLHAGKSREELFKKRKEHYAALAKDHTIWKLDAIQREIDGINRSITIRGFRAPFGITHKGEFLATTVVVTEEL